MSLAIVGASGSGKSTLLGMLAGLDIPSEGEIFIAGQALHQMDEEQRAKLRSEKIGFVFQSFLLIPELTALENVMLPAELRGIKQARELATTLLKAVGLGERLQHKPAKLSGGEQQRVALARAFIGQPALLLADEMTPGNLDQHTGQKIADLLFRMNKESGSSLVIVTHGISSNPLSAASTHAGRAVGGVAMIKLLWRLFCRMGWRSGLQWFVLALAVCIASVLSVSLVSDRLTQSLKVSRAAIFLAADRVVESANPLPDFWLKQAHYSGLQLTHTTEFSTMLLAGEQMQLASAKAIESGYPFYGHLVLAPQQSTPGRALAFPSTHVAVAGEIG